MHVISDQEKYINEVFGLSDPDLEPVKEALARNGVDRMSISGHEARMLQFLIRGFQVEKIVEVGTLYGYSALCMAKALPSSGRIFTLEKNPEHWGIAQQSFKASADGHKVISMCGEALELLAQIEKDGPFDMAFIDANKGGYAEYLDWAEKNVRKGGLIVGDNTFLWGGVFDKSTRPDSGDNQIRVMKEFNKRLADPKRYNSTLIPTTEGMTVAQKLY